MTFLESESWETWSLRYWLWSLISLCGRRSLVQPVTSAIGLLNKGSTTEPDYFDSRVSRGAAAVVGGVLLLLAGLWAGAGILEEVRAFRAGEGQYFEAARPSLEDEFPIVVECCQLDDDPSGS